MTIGVRTSGKLSVQASWSKPLTVPDYVQDKGDVWSVSVRYTF